MSHLTAITISIGDELLAGNTVDSNNAFISQKLEQLGIPVTRKYIIADDLDAILETLDQALKNAAVVTVTGGLGPTHDDITKVALCKFFNDELILDESILANIRKRFESRGIKMSAINRNQAEYPTKAKLLPNPAGTALGMHFNHEGSDLFVMPGVPREMVAIMESSVVPILTRKGATPWYSTDVLTNGIPESTLFDKAHELIIDQPDLKVAFLPRHTGVTVRLSVPADHKNAVAYLDGLYRALRERFPKHVYGRDNSSLAAEVGTLCKRHGLKIATAESCTGGLIASQITDVAGSSAYYETGFVTYANATKIKTLGVKASTLESHGAVSEETVTEMLAGLLATSQADYGIAVSGIAGPDGGSAEKPVGTVYIGVASHERLVVKRFQFWKDRILNKEVSAATALNMLRLMLEEDLNE